MRFGFNVISVTDTIYLIWLMLLILQGLKGMPTIIIAKTVKGKGVSFMENQIGCFGKAPNEEEYNKSNRRAKQVNAKFNRYG